MANVDVTILRQDYKDSTQSTAQYNGYEPNTISAALGASGNAKSIVGCDGTADKQVVVEADFKDAKTVFVVNNTYGATKTLTLCKGNSYQGVNDIALTCPDGISMFWVDSAKFIDKTSGKMYMKTDAVTAEGKDLTLVAYEMR